MLRQALDALNQTTAQMQQVTHRGQILAVCIAIILLALAVGAVYGRNK